MFTQLLGKLSFDTAELKKLKKEILLAEQHRSEAPQKIAELEQELSLWKQRQDAPFATLQQRVSELCREAESLFIDAKRLKPQDPVMYAAAVAMMAQDMTIDEVVDALGSERIFDICLAQSKTMKPLSISRTSGSIPMLFRFEEMYKAMDKEADLNRLKEISEAISEVQPLIDKSIRNIKRIDAGLQPISLEKQQGITTHIPAPQGYMGAAR